MYNSFSFLLLSLVTLAEAYPSIVQHVARTTQAKRSDTVFNRLRKRVTGFDAASQLIDVSGDHAFSPPTSGDQRGPCPGLNALANHNYLPHNGVATINEFIDATTSVFGMGLDLATVLSTYGAVVDGDLTSWSIGGPTASVASLLGLAGEPQGISGSHNKYEGDASPTRGDLYEYKNDYLLQMSQFQALYDAGKAQDSYDLDVLTTFRATRFQQSITNNPYFFYGPFSGVIVTPAAYSFIYRFMSNKSEEYPDGLLNGDVLKSFFAITGDGDEFTYTPGHERIPENWYTRNAADPYGIVGLNLDTDAMAEQNPEFLIPGGNTGTINSYIGVDPSDLTGGVITADNLLQNNNAFCLAFESTLQFLPDLVKGVVADVTSALTPSFSSVISELGCPQLTLVDEGQFTQYPGSTKLKSDGSY